MNPWARCQAPSYSVLLPLCLGTGLRVTVLQCSLGSQVIWRGELTLSHKACSFHGLFGTWAPRMGWTTAAGPLLALGQGLSRAKRKQTRVLVQEGCLCR